MAMKKAPSIRPPPNTLYAMYCTAVIPTSAGAEIRDRIATVPMNATGVCQLMTLRISSHAPPSSSARAETSPREPPIRPMNMSATE